MADIIIHVTQIGGCEDDSYINIGGYVRAGGMSAELGSVVWDVNVPANALAGTINSAIKDAAITQLELLEISVGALDKKTLLGGAVGL